MFNKNIIYQFQCFRYTRISRLKAGGNILTRADNKISLIIVSYECIKVIRSSILYGAIAWDVGL